MIGYIGKRHRQMLIKRGTRLVVFAPARRTCRSCHASPPCFLLYLSGLSAVLVAVATPPCCTCRACRDSRTCTCGTCRACRRHSRLSALREEAFFSAFRHFDIPAFRRSDGLRHLALRGGSRLSPGKLPHFARKRIAYSVSTLKGQ